MTSFTLSERTRFASSRERQLVRADAVERRQQAGRGRNSGPAWRRCVRRPAGLAPATRRREASRLAANRDRPRRRPLPSRPLRRYFDTVRRATPSRRERGARLRGLPQGSRLLRPGRAHGVAPFSLRRPGGAKTGESGLASDRAARERILSSDRRDVSTSQERAHSSGSRISFNRAPRIWVASAIFGCSFARARASF